MNEEDVCAKTKRGSGVGRDLRGSLDDGRSVSDGTGEGWTKVASAETGAETWGVWDGRKLGRKVETVGMIKKELET